MRLSIRRLALAATATALGIGGALLPSASAMAATTPDHSATVTAAPSQSTAETAHATSTQPTGYWCAWDAWGNWACVWW